MLFFALRCFSVKFAPFDFFSLVTKLSKVCQIHTFAVIFVVAVVDCLELFFYPSQLPLALNKLRSNNPVI